jgi:hypothetical protein
MPRPSLDPQCPAYVDLYWLPLGAGRVVVRWCGRAYESIVARRQHRRASALFHSALVVRHGAERYVIEMTPVWGNGDRDRGVVGEGPVGLRRLGRLRWFRYEVRRWRDGVIPDIAFAIGSPRRVSTDGDRARALLDLVPRFPAVTWGRDELATGAMWNSNSLIAWLLARTGHPADRYEPPGGGQAPGWSAGVVLAARDARCARPRSADRPRAASVR